MRHRLPKSFLVCAIVASVAATARTAAAEDAAATGSAPRVAREFAGFITDAETARGLWVEVGETVSGESDAGPDVTLLTTNMRAVYGQEKWEVGTELPYLYADVANTAGNNAHDNLGDMRLYGKFLPVRTDRFTFGGGLTLSFPTGDGFATADEYGFEPFLTGAVQCGPASIRAHFGYATYASNGTDSLDYSLAAIYPMGEMTALRTEIVGRHILDDFADAYSDPISILPGVDLRTTDGNWDILLRLAAGAGLTEESPDYQVGVSLVLAQVGS